MCKTQTKLDRPTANVINEVEILQDKINLNRIEICLIIITVLIGLNFLLRIYTLHNKRLKKKYLSKANDLDKI